MQDDQEACKWAYDLLQRKDWCILDTETSGLKGVVLELAIISPDGRELFNGLVNPDGVRIEEGARAVHGISDEELERAPRLPEIWPTIQTALAESKTIIAYNAAFDQARIEQTARRYGLPQLSQEWQCAMLQYAQFYGEWNDYRGDYKWQRLPGAGHRALDDARAALAVIQKMAAAWEGEQQGQPVAGEVGAQVTRPAWLK